MGARRAASETLMINRLVWLGSLAVLPLTACHQASGTGDASDEAGSVTGTGGVAAAGSSRGSGGSGGRGDDGTAGEGGESSGEAGAGASGAGSEISCTFDVTTDISVEIPTVGIVTFSTDLAKVDSAHIDFGLDSEYGLSAPVDLDEDDYRTLLLGMKPSRTYHFRIVASSGSERCESEDFTIATGPPPEGVPEATITTNSADDLAGGFLVTEWYRAGFAFILDEDGDIVWWHDTGLGSLTSATMSYDGKYMWIANYIAGAETAPVGEEVDRVFRVKMDGTDAEDLSSQFRDMNHDLAVLPDETVVFLANEGDCDKLMERLPTGETRMIFSLAPVSGESCHANAVQYSPDDDTVLVSDLSMNAIVKVTRQGELVWVLGGNGSRNDFTGDGAVWEKQHNFRILEDDRLLIFNNGADESEEGSKAIEVQLDLTDMTATKLWEYAASPAINNIIMGDVQRLDNGNTLVVFSTQQAIHEVSPDGSVVQAITWPQGGAVGYAHKRNTLYGPPPR